MNTSLLSRIGVCSILTCCLVMTVMANEQSPRKPNIVLIISDDHDNEHLGFVGNKVVRTPNTDLPSNS